MAFLCSCTWLTFGVITKDWNVMIPNMLGNLILFIKGVLFSIIQIGVYIVFYNKSKTNSPELQGLMK
jgi:hypothetical protein